MHRHQNIGQRLAGVEVQGEQKTMTIEHNGFFRLFQQHQVGHPLFEHMVLLSQLYHIFIEVVEPLIFQVAVILQTPLPPAIVEAPAVAFPGEVNPFRVTEFVAHEVQVCPRRRRPG